MGVVYKARDPLIGRLVALKTITSGLAEQPEMLERFYREARAAGGLAHPNIVTIYELGEENKTPYIAMEFLEGIALEKIIEERQPLPLSQKIGYIFQVGRALDYAHKRGVVHRDIKPGNVVITHDGTVKVVDFGIARLVDTSRSQTGLLIGTVNYMSPEQVRGERVDGRSDIFSVGVMFYELMSYQRPFVGANFTAVMLAIIGQEPKPLSQVAPECPADLDTLLGKILKKDLADRYQSMEEVLLDLEPLYRRLRQETVGQMVKQTHELMENKEFEKARDVLREVMLIDSTHKEAKTLLEKINVALRRGLVGPKVKQHLATASELLAQGKVSEAQAEVEDALKLDSVYEPAQELLKQVQAETERAKRVQEGLRTAQQRLAEGNLTEAEQKLDQLLAMDAKNPSALKLRQQLAQEKERRQKRQRLLDTLQKARALWTQQNFDESIRLLETLQKEFPGDEEVAKLLETVRLDQWEQQKHELLAEARRLLGEQRFQESLQILDQLLDRNPNETGIQKLRSLVVEGRKEHAQRVRLQHEQQAMMKLVSEEKFKEAIAQGEQLLKEFPNDFELTRLVEFARTQQTQIDQQRRRKEKSEELQALTSRGNLQEAISVAEKALEAFPADPEFTRVLEDLRRQQKEKEKKEYVEKQIRGIKAAIDTGNLTDAIDLGRQTLAAVKHDTDITRLLQFAEREYQLREQRRETDQQLKTAIFLMESKKFEEATEVLENVQKTVIFDPRVHSLLEAAKSKEVPKPAELEELEKTLVGVAGVAPEQQYVLQVPGGPAVAPPADEAGVAGARAQATAPVVEPTPIAPPLPVAPAAPPETKTAPSATPEPEVIPKPAAPPPAPPAAPPKKKAKPVVEEPAPPKPAPPPAEPTVAPPAPPEAKPAVERPAAPPPMPPVIPPPPKPVVEAPPPKPAPAVAPPLLVEAPPKPFLQTPAGMAAMGVLVIGLAVGGYFVFRPGGGTGPGPGGATSAPPTAGPSLAEQQQQLRDQANELADKGDYVGAIQQVDKALGLNGPLNSDLGKLKDQLQLGAQNAKVWAQEKTVFDQAKTAFDQNKFDPAEKLFKQVVGMKGGRRQSDAQRYVSELIPARKQEEKYMADAKRLANSSNPADLSTAKGMLDTVSKGTGPRKQEAVGLLKQVEAKLAALGKEAVIAGSMKAGRDALSRGDYNAARRSAEDIKAQGGDPSQLLNDVNTAIRNSLAQYTSRFKQLRGGKDPSALEALQGEVKRFADASGDATARDLGDNQIPAAVRSMRDQLAAEEKQRAEQQAGAEFDKAKAVFDAAKNPGDLKRAQAALDPIANAGGPYASKARELLGRVAGRMEEMTPRTCPQPQIALQTGMKPAVKEGQMISAELLDSPLTWVTCSLPPTPDRARQAGVSAAVVRIFVDVDSNGNVTNVKPQGAKDTYGFYDAVEAAAHNWKTSPPKAKGLPVKTEFFYTIDFK